MPELHSPLPGSEAPLTHIPFSARTEASIRALCNWMQIAAVISILAAVGKGISAFAPRRDFGNLIDAVITLLIALWIYQASTAFRKVVTTDTADQSYLMEAFTLLRRVFLLQAILVILALTFLVIALVVITLVMLTHSNAR